METLQIKLIAVHGEHLANLIGHKPSELELALSWCKSLAAMYRIRHPFNKGGKNE